MDKKAKAALIIALVLVGILLVSLAIAKKPGTRAAKECNDKTDNDGDGAIDLADSGCDNKQDNDETDCGDGVCEGGEVCDVCVADCGICDSCSDTDGHDTMVQGTVSGYSSGSLYSYDDYCVSSSVVKEHYCVGTQASNYDFYCPALGNSTSYICSNGACVPE